MVFIVMKLLELVFRFSKTLIFDLGILRFFPFDDTSMYSTCVNLHLVCVCIYPLLCNDCILQNK